MLVAQYMQFIIICHTHIRRVNTNILKSITLLPLEKISQQYYRQKSSHPILQFVDLLLEADNKKVMSQSEPWLDIAPQI